MMLRIKQLLALATIVLGGTVVAAPAAHAQRSIDCYHESGVQWCTYLTEGYASWGAFGTTGEGDQRVGWESWNGQGFQHVYGDLCVKDTWANGRGVKVNLNLHRAGTPWDNNQDHYWSATTVKDGNCASFDGYAEGGFDGMYINYADVWSSCGYCWRGSYQLAYWN